MSVDILTLTWHVRLAVTVAEDVIIVEFVQDFKVVELDETVEVAKYDEIFVFIKNVAI